MKFLGGAQSQLEQLFHRVLPPSSVSWAFRDEQRSAAVRGSLILKTSDFKARLFLPPVKPPHQPGRGGVLGSRQAGHLALPSHQYITGDGWS